jgi:hypothetical protein
VKLLKPSQVQALVTPVYPTTIFNKVLLIIMADIFAQVRAAQATLPVVPQQNANTTVFHVIKLPSIGARSPKVLAEWAIQPLSDNVARQATWWTSYIIVAKNGLLQANTGVFTSWPAFATQSPAGSFMNVIPRTDGVIFDVEKGVNTGFLGNTAIAHKYTVPCGVSQDSDVYALLVVVGMHDGRYQVHGTSRISTD